MANPLHIFRKYQYAFLVGFGIMLMFAFVVAPPLSDYLQIACRDGRRRESRRGDVEGGRVAGSRIGSSAHPASADDPLPGTLGPPCGSGRGSDGQSGRANRSR